MTCFCDLMTPKEPFYNANAIAPGLSSVRFLVFMVACFSLTLLPPQLAGGSQPSNAGSKEPPAWKKHVVVAKRKTAINTVVADDFNKDGHIDVIASYDNQVVLLQGPEWNPQTLHVFKATDARTRPRRHCIHSCLMDVDGDGDQDFCGSNNTVFWLECPQDPFSGTWKYRTVDDEILGTHCLITGDVDRDGKLDLIANSFRTEEATSIPNSIVWLKVPKDPYRADHWNRHVFAQGDAPGGSHYMGFGDVNGDGRPDIACGAKGGEGFPGGEWFAWWEQPSDPTGRWTKHLLSAKQPGASNIHPIDVDQDGNMDFVASRGHDQGVLWFRGPKWEAISIDDTMLGPHCLVTVDLDGDDRVDIATCGRDLTGKCVWYKNLGQGKFQKQVIGNDQSAYDLRAVDMDSDGDLDLLVAGCRSKNVVWFENPTMHSKR